MKKIEYLIKHNAFFQKLYVFVFSGIFRLIGVFVRPRKNQAFFQSMIGKNFGDSPRVLYEAMRSDPEFRDFRYVWAFDHPEAFEIPQVKKVKLNSLSYFIESLRSCVWVTNVDIERGLAYKPRRTVYLNTWHGAPLKHSGNMQKNRSDYNYSDVDFMCSCSEFEDLVFERDFRVRREALVRCGMPRLDVLYGATQQKKEALKAQYGIPPEKKVILYMPTWRDSADGGSSYVIAPPIHMELWREKLAEDYVLLFRMHHLSTKQIGLVFDDFVRDFSGDHDVNELMMMADLLISDYSGAILEYSILERPILSFAYDYEEFKKARGLYFDLEDLLPGSVFSNETQVLDFICGMDYEKECEKIRRMKGQHMQTDGNATQTCMDFLRKAVAENFEKSR